MNLNPFSALTWSWRALRSHSVTFSALFGLGVLGFSVVAEFRHLLTRLGAPWYVWLIVPFLAVAYFARKEADWLPDVRTRRRWSRGLFFGSILLAILIAKFGPSKRNQTQATPEPAAAPVRQGGR